MGIPAPRSFALAPRLAALCAALCLAVLAPSPARAQEAALLVRVTSDSTEVPVPFSEVQVDSGGWVRTGLDGVWRGVLAPGRHRVDARAQGYRERSFAIYVEAGEEMALTLPIVEDLYVLDPVTGRVIRGRTRMLRDFHGRAARRSGGGVFITRDMIESRPGARFTDLVRLIAAPRMTQGPAAIAAGAASGIAKQSFGRFQSGAENAIDAGLQNSMDAGMGNNAAIEEACQPIYVVDGRIRQLHPGQHADLEFQLGEIEGIEVYPNGTFAPAPFTGRIAACGVILIWTR